MTFGFKKKIKNIGQASDSFNNISNIGWEVSSALVQLTYDNYNNYKSP